MSALGQEQTFYIPQTSPIRPVAFILPIGKGTVRPVIEKQTPAYAYFAPLRSLDAVAHSSITVK